MKKLLLFAALSCIQFIQAQELLTPEKLWQIQRVSALGISKDKQYIVYAVATPDITANKNNRKKYKVPIAGGTAVELADNEDLIYNDRLSPDGKFILYTDEVKLNKVAGKEWYPDLPKSDAYVYTSLNYRHWDTWEDGEYNHVFVAPYANGKSLKGKDIMPNEPYDAPTKPFGGDEDFIWHPDGKHIVYVAKKKYGTDYAISTNTDLYQYNIETGVTTINLTEANKGYDLSTTVQPKWNTCLDANEKRWI
jgi:Tol biopolymer transport system component